MSSGLSIFRRAPISGLTAVTVVTALNATILPTAIPLPTSSNGVIGG